MARNKQPTKKTKKHLTDENDLLHQKLKELEGNVRIKFNSRFRLPVCCLAQIASLRPTSASQAADGQPSADLQALTDENYDPWTDPTSNSNLGATLVKFPRCTRAGSTRTTSGRVLAGEILCTLL